MFEHKRNTAAFVARLVEHEQLSHGTTQRVLAALEKTDHPVDTVLTELGIVREDTLLRLVSAFTGLEIVDDISSVVDADLSRRLGLGFLAAHAVVPLSGSGPGEVVMAVADPFRGDAVEMLEYLWEKPPSLRLAPRSAIRSVITSLQEQEQDASSDEAWSPASVEDDLERLRDIAQQAPIVRLVAAVIQAAYDQHATDIHFEPLEHSLRVRIRVDGDLRLIEKLSRDDHPGIATRLKILAGLDISERRLPQDGRMRLAVRGQDIDFRVSVVPTLHGETIVLRLLDQSAIALDLPSLGYEDGECDRLWQIVSQPNGLLLVVGPTGSGKTTTLYALISAINRPDLKIFTIEDPVEYRLNGITQLQVNAATGLTFARSLRSVLRQDPDVILVGEIRDRETAGIAMQAALTGHLVLSTLHTSSAVGAITRLRDMGIEDYLIAATAKGVVGQRLLRRRCLQCMPADVPGCESCGGSGLKGRTAAYEILEVTPDFAAAVASGASEDALTTQLLASGFVSIEKHADMLVQRQVTTRAEVARVIRLGL